ncbi:MAG: hypothetical protein H6828_08555 [Planctomycetes bacterium]|nr:hypothetical protein [Planctomycetota bacterium]
MSWFKKLGPESRSLETIHGHFQEMLRDAKTVVDKALDGLLGRADAKALHAEVFATDERVNQAATAVRRELVVHGTVHGTETFPSLLVIMSLVKDAERIGDYGKNLLLLGEQSLQLGSAADRAALERLGARISKGLGIARELYATEDAEGGEAFMKESKAITAELDALVNAGLAATGENAAARVLALRFLKRVQTHASNIVSSLVLPLDQIDFYDEKR